MIMPVQADTFADGLRVCAEIYHNLKKICKERGLSTAVGDEGGFAPDLGSSSDVLRLIVESIEASGLCLPARISKLQSTRAASELYDEKTKRYYFPGESRMSGSEVYRDSEAMVDYYEQLIREFPILSIEDGLFEDDWDGWKMLTERLGEQVQLVGDDLFVTNTKRLDAGIKLALPMRY